MELELDFLVFAQVAREMLDVVTDFVRNDIGEGEVSVDVDFFHRFEEGEIEIDRFVDDAIKRPRAFVALATGRVDRTGIVDDFWGSVLVAERGDESMGKSGS